MKTRKLGNSGLEVTEKKQQKGGFCGNRQKDCASHEVRMVGIFDGWWFSYKNLDFTRHSSNKFGSALARTRFALRSCP